MFLDDYRAGLSQGDILDAVTVWDPIDDAVAPRTTRVVVLSEDCEMRKPAERGRYVLVVEARAIGETSAANAGNIRAGRGFNAFHIPAVGRVAEGFIDFGRVYRVERLALERALASGNRQASMTDEARQAVLYGFLSYLLHEEIPPTAAASPLP